MNTSIPKEATILTMEYTYYHEIPLPDDINRDDIKRWWVRHAILTIEMNDGTLHEYEGDVNLASIPWKHGQKNLEWVDDDYTPLTQDNQEEE